jgi:hypothetical protein
LPFAKKWGDFSLCSWPESLIRHEDFTTIDTKNSKNFALAKSYANLNEKFLNRTLDGASVTISMSHFIPRQELLPEKRFLTEPLLSRVSGSVYLEEQIRRLKPE